MSESTGVSAVTLNEHVLLDYEDGVPHRIDCSLIFVLIGPILIDLLELNLIV